MFIFKICKYFDSFRSLREEGEGRLPLRDAVEKRPISLIDRAVAFKTVEVIISDLLSHIRNKIVLNSYRLDK